MIDRGIGPSLHCSIAKSRGVTMFGRATSRATVTSGQRLPCSARLLKAGVGPCDWLIYRVRRVEGCHCSIRNAGGGGGGGGAVSFGCTICKA